MFNSSIIILICEYVNLSSNRKLRNIFFWKFKNLVILNRFPILKSVRSLNAPQRARIKKNPKKWKRFMNDLLDVRN